MIILRSVVYFIKVVTSAYLRSGGDGYTMLKDPLFVHPGDLAVNHVIEYMKKHTPLITPVEGRISFTEEKPCLSSKSSILYTHHTRFLMSIIVIVSFYSKTWKTEKYELILCIYAKCGLQNTENSWGVSRTAATSKMERFVIIVNRCCSSARSAPVFFWKMFLLHNQRFIEHSRKHVRWRAL